jgi:hypothetical protein
MSSVAFSVPVSVGANAVTASDLTINSGTWNTHASATGSNSLNTTLERIVAEIPSSVAQTSSKTDISGGSSTANARADHVKGYVEDKITALVDGAPGALNTLNELAAALNDEANYAATIATSLGNKAALAGSSSQAFDVSTLTAATSATMPKLLATAPTVAGLQIGSDAATNKYRLVVKDDSVIVYKHNTAVMTITG